MSNSRERDVGAAKAIVDVVKLKEAQAELADERRLRHVAEEALLKTMDQMTLLKEGVLRSERQLEELHVRLGIVCTELLDVAAGRLPGPAESGEMTAPTPAVDPTEPPFDTWARAFASSVGLSARFELEVRVFAEAHPQTRGLAFSDLKKVCQAIFAEFGPAFDANAQRAISTARELRNKLIHCEFWTAETLIEEHSGPLSTTGSVYSYDDVSGTQTNRAMTADDFRIYGWLMEGDQEDGLFPRAGAIFMEAIRILRGAERHRAQSH